MHEPYVISNGRLQADACEVEIVQHCNLSCRACSHLSPVLPRHFLDPADVERDLTRLARSYQALRVRLQGGEPLPHPDIVGMIAAVRRSGIAERISILTNGTLLPRMGEDFWSAIDELRISSYPGSELGPEQISSCRELARRFDVGLASYSFPAFRETASTRERWEPEMASRIYRSCEMAHTLRCHTVIDGMFYRCPQSRFLPMVLQPGDAEALRRDALPIDDDPGFAERLRAWLQAEEPLHGCASCLGSVGRTRPHANLRRQEWAADLDRPLLDLLDEDYLVQVEGSRGWEYLRCVDDVRYEHLPGPLGQVRWLLGASLSSRRVRRLIPGAARGLIRRLKGW